MFKANNKKARTTSLPEHFSTRNPSFLELDAFLIAKTFFQKRNPVLKVLENCKN